MGGTEGGWEREGGGRQGERKGRGKEREGDGGQGERRGGGRRGRGREGEGGRGKGSEGEVEEVARRGRVRAKRHTMKEKKEVRRKEKENDTEGYGEICEKRGNLEGREGTKEETEDNEL